MEDIQKRLQKRIRCLQRCPKDFHKAISQRKLLDGRLNENKVVKEELDVLKKEAEVYKLIGPVLIKQDLSEARQNVEKRMEFISKELKRTDEHIETLDTKQENHAKTLAKLQQEFQQAQVKATVKA